MPGPLSYDDVVLAGVVGLVALYTALRHPGRFLPALQIAYATFKTLVPIIILAIFSATFVAQLIPGQALASLIGSQSGFKGILIASLIGALIPGGPMITFPFVVTFSHAGAGTAQLIAMITGWSVVAIHRLISLEAPMMGSRFVMRRLISTFFLAPLSGLIAIAIISILG